ncbi:MAG: SURF1 family protein [Pseudomonadota bacterium]
MRASTAILLVCIALGVAFLCGLGVWQLNRLAWKEALIARVEAGLEAPPVSVSAIGEALRSGEDIEYRPMQATGRFLNESEAHYFATHKSRPGYFVYTPFQLNDDRILMVNRGYVPMDAKAQAGRTDGLVPGSITINGLARSAPTQKPNSLVPDNDLAKNVFHWKSLPQMVDLTLPDGSSQVLPFFMDVDNTPHTGRWPEGGVTLIQFPNSHLQYAFTWFGLAGALLAVGASFLWSRRRSNQTA